MNDFYKRIDASVFSRFPLINIREDRVSFPRNDPTTVLLISNEYLDIDQETTEELYDILVVLSDGMTD